MRSQTLIRREWSRAAAVGVKIGLTLKEAFEEEGSVVPGAGSADPHVGEPIFITCIHKFDR